MAQLLKADPEFDALADDLERAYRRIRVMPASGERTLGIAAMHAQVMRAIRSGTNDPPREQLMKAMRADIAELDAIGGAPQPLET